MHYFFLHCCIATFTTVKDLNTSTVIPQLLYDAFLDTQPITISVRDDQASLSQVLLLHQEEEKGSLTSLWCKCFVQTAVLFPGLNAEGIQGMGGFSPRPLCRGPHASWTHRWCALISRACSRRADTFRPCASQQICEPCDITFDLSTSGCWMLLLSLMWEFRWCC